MFTIRASRRAPKLLLLLTVVATAVVFLAPAAEAAAGLSVGKTASPAEGGTVSPGDTIDYTVLVQNAGPDATTGLTLTDPTPAGTSYVADSATVDSVQVLGATNPFDTPYSLPDIAAGGSHTVTFRVTVDSPMANGSSVSNTATASATNATDASDSATHTVASAPSLTVSKTASPAEGGSVAPGDRLTYTVVVGNAASATDTANGVSVTDPLPANTSYVAGSATEDGSSVAGATNPFEAGYTLTDSTLSPGETHTLTFEVDVDSPLPNGTLITNTATATATNPGNASDSATHTVASAPGLAVDKTASPPEGGPVVPGETITYSIVVTNDALATDNATNVVLTDATPEGTTYVAESATVDTVAVPGATNPFESGYSLPNMAPGDSHTLTFQVLADPVLDNGSSITNTATLDSDQGSATDDATHTVQSQSVLDLEKTSSPAEGGPVTPGTTVTYSIVVTNAAEANEVAEELVLTDPTPAGTTYVQGSAKLDGVAIEGEGNPLQEGYAVPDLAPGETATVTYDVTVDSPLAKGTVVSNMAKLTAENHPELTDEATHTVDSAAVMKVEVTASPVAGTEVKKGQTIQYNVKVSNDPSATQVLNVLAVVESPPLGTSAEEGTAAETQPRLTDASAAASSDVAAESDGSTVVLYEEQEVVNYVWWLAAHSKNPSDYIANALGNAIAIDAQFPPGTVSNPPPHSILLALMTRTQLVAFRAAHPEASIMIDQTLVMYDELRPLVLYMLGHYQVDLGLVTSDQVPYLENGRVVLRGESAASESAADPAVQMASSVESSTEAVESDSLAGVDLAPGASATAAFTVTVGASAAGELTNTVTVFAANHPNVVVTTTHRAPEASDDDGNGGGNGGGGRAFGPGGGGGTTTTLESAVAAGESLAFTGLDLAKLVLLSLSLLLAGWVLLARGRILQTRAVEVTGRRPAYELPTGPYAPRTWFFLPTQE